MEHSILQFQYHTLNFFVNHTNSEREIEIGGAQWTERGQRHA